MKRTYLIFTLTLFFLFTISVMVFSQMVSKNTGVNFPDKLKQEGILTDTKAIINPNPQPSPIRIYPSNSNATVSSCDCWIQHDSIWQVAQFDGSGFNGGPGLPPEYRNDDWSTLPIVIPFNFCFYGQQVSEVYINNNGNVSIDIASPRFSSDTFPNSNVKMLAPFWGDVDTRGIGSGIVQYELTSSHLIIQWDSVGYYDSHDTLRNSFQMIITDGTDQLLQNGKNVSFCYKDMQWTTGDASAGINGFGGLPAIIGVNKGNGLEYISIGQFDTSGIGYSGFLGSHNGVDFLDNQSFQFNVCDSGANIPPIASVPYLCDTIILCVNDTLDFSVEYFSPELSQITIPTIDIHGTSGVTLLNSVSGNTAFIEVAVVGSIAGLGFHTIILSATDNGSPPQTTDIPVHINVVPPAIAGFSYFPPSPVNTGSIVFFTNSSISAQGYFWDFGDGSGLVSIEDTSHVYFVDGTYTISLIAEGRGGCSSDTLSQNITVLTTGVNLIQTVRLPVIVPNPARNEITLTNAENYAELNLEIYNAIGKTLRTYSHVESLTIRGLEKLERGIYFYRITNELSQIITIGKLVLN